MPFRPPSLRSIAAFEAAARHESFSKAARELNLTHSAISHSIRGLEDRLGERLFARNGRRVSLTSDGELLARRVRVSLALMAEALDDARACGGERRLVLAAPSEFAATALAQRLSAFRAAFADVALEVRPDLGPAAPAEGRADCAVAFGTPGWPGLSAELIQPERVFAVVSPGRAGPAPRGTARALAGQALIENPAYPWAAFLQRVGRSVDLPAPAVVAADWMVALEMAAAGAGVALTRASLARGHLASGRLLRLGDDEAPCVEGYHLIWNPRTADAELMRRFGAWLRAADPAPRLERVA